MPEQSPQADNLQNTNNLTMAALSQPMESMLPRLLNSTEGLSEIEQLKTELAYQKAHDVALQAGIMLVGDELGRKAIEASHDKLTGTKRKEELEPEIARRMVTGEPFVVFFIDLNNFSDVNNLFGHARGDEVLRHYGNMLNTKFKRRTDFINLPHDHPANIESDPDHPENDVIRAGGDEFAIILSKPGNHQRQPKAWVVHELEYLNDCNEQYRKEVVDKYPQLRPYIGVSVGYAIWEPGFTGTPADLVELADARMYIDKEESKRLAAAAPSKLE